MKNKLTLKGDKEFIKKLKGAMKKAPQVTSKVIKNGAEFGKELSIRKAPEDTGHLKLMHITQYPALNIALIVSSASYSAYVNWGTRFMSGRPFFSDMWVETQEKLKDDFDNVIKGVLTD